MSTAVARHCYLCGEPLGSHTVAIAGQEYHRLCVQLLAAPVGRTIADELAEALRSTLERLEDHLHEGACRCARCDAAIKELREGLLARYDAGKQP